MAFGQHLQAPCYMWRPEIVQYTCCSVFSVRIRIVKVEERFGITHIQQHLSNVPMKLHEVIHNKPVNLSFGYMKTCTKKLCNIYIHLINHTIDAKVSCHGLFTDRFNHRETDSPALGRDFSMLESPLLF